METDLTQEQVETDLTQEQVETDLIQEQVETDLTQEQMETDLTQEQMETDLIQEQVEVQQHRNHNRHRRPYGNIVIKAGVIKIHLLSFFMINKGKLKLFE